MELVAARQIDGYLFDDGLLIFGNPIMIGGWRAYQLDSARLESMLALLRGPGWSKCQETLTEGNTVMPVLVSKGSQASK